MALPLILGGAAALLGVTTGAALAVDGMENQDKANKILETAKNRYDIAKDHLDLHNNRVQDKLEYLGKIYLSISQDFDKFKEISDELLDKLNEHSNHYLTINLPSHKIEKIQNTAVNFNSLATNMAGGLASGALAGAATYAGVMTFGTASTGTAISTLSGAAASKATWAALGGGALKAGGLGMMGGFAVAGSLVAAPAIALMGWAYSEEAEKSLQKAEESLIEVEMFEQKTKQAISYLANTGWYVNDIISGINEVYKQFYHYLDNLTQVAQLVRDDQLSLLNEEDQIMTSIQNGYALASILTDIITTPIFKIKTKGSQIMQQPAPNGIQITMNENTSSYLSRLNKLLNTELAQTSDIHQIEELKKDAQEAVDNIQILFDAVTESVQKTHQELEVELVNAIDTAIDGVKILILTDEFYKSGNSDGIDHLIKNALITKDNKALNTQVKNMVKQAQSYGAYDDIFDLPISDIISCIKTNTDFLHETIKDEITSIKQNLKTEWIDVMADNPLALLDEDSFDCIIADIQTIIDSWQPENLLSQADNPTQESTEINLDSNTVLKALEVDANHHSYNNMKKATDSFIARFNDAKSSVAETLKIQLDAHYTQLIIDQQQLCLDMTVNNSNDSNTDEFDWDQLDQISFNHLMYAALTADNNDDFMENVEQIMELSDDVLGGQSKETITQSLLQARNELNQALEYNLNKAKDSLKKEYLSDFNAEDWIDDLSSKLNIQQKPIQAKLQKLIYEDFAKTIQDSISSYSASDWYDDESKGVEFEQKDGMNVINQEEMNQLLLNAKQALTQYQ